MNNKFCLGEKVMYKDFELTVETIAISISNPTKYWCCAKVGLLCYEEQLRSIDNSETIIVTPKFNLGEYVEVMTKRRDLRGYVSVAPGDIVKIDEIKMSKEEIVYCYYFISDTNSYWYTFKEAELGKIIENENFKEKELCLKRGK